MSAERQIDIDLLRELSLPAVAGETDKNTRGRVLVVGGSRRVPGAPLLSGMSALRIGAGKVQLAIPSSLATVAGMTFLEAGICPLNESSDGEPLALPAEELISAAHAADAVLAGPGIMSQQAAGHLLKCLLREVVGPVYVIDALALCELWNETSLLSKHAGRIILTPHAGEMAQLTGLEKVAIDSDPVGVAREAAAHLSSIVVLKGATTLVVTPSGLAYRHSQGVVGLATAGSGDVLAGIIAGLASRGAAPAAAAAWGVYLHGRAGTHLSHTVGRLGFTARDLTEQLPRMLEATEGRQNRHRASGPG